MYKSFQDRAITVSLARLRGNQTLAVINIPQIWEDVVVAETKVTKKKILKIILKQSKQTIKGTDIRITTVY